eukprot:TRINITY_DN9092_c0_g1::TRINITY_DN9092_c0_g1_i1::g.18275::m.18275 TRINITY_DN9092_c0_g1::TRINITY_DN9092_c0_g1_i1::g.18275  ORF type:complete len:153 (+),score=13.66,Syndecan/PF01034.15/0.045,SecG/PF03840.9/7.1e+02,SecG/PF03840.9/0.24,Mid2/PF04478.7/7.9 TRINITY_DN9092_c0_g1_i1:38-496(+)
MSTNMKSSLWFACLLLLHFLSLVVAQNATEPISTETFTTESSTPESSTEDESSPHHPADEEDGILEDSVEGETSMEKKITAGIVVGIFSIAVIVTVLLHMRKNKKGCFRPEGYEPQQDQAQTYAVSASLPVSGPLPVHPSMQPDPEPTAHQV